MPKNLAAHIRVVRGVLELKIVWRNLNPPMESERRVEAIAIAEFGALYGVRIANTIAAFEVILGGAARLGPNALNESKGRYNRARFLWKR